MYSRPMFDPPLAFVFSLARRVEMARAIEEHFRDITRKCPRPFLARPRSDYVEHALWRHGMRVRRQIERPFMW